MASQKEIKSIFVISILIKLCTCVAIPIYQLLANYTVDLIVTETKI